MVFLASPAVDAAATTHMSGLIKAGLDFERLRSLLIYHRVVAAASANLSPELSALMPEAFSRWLLGRRAAIRQQAVRQYQTHTRLGVALTRAGVPHRFFKGLALSHLLHADLAMRQSKDIDVMIPREYLFAADACLREMGYNSILADDRAMPTGNRLAVALGKDVLYRAKGMPEVELHWRIDNARTRFSEFYSHALFNLPPDVTTPQECVYLCWHAGKTLHHRFKWLVDIDCYLRIAEAADAGFIGRVLAVAKQQGVERYVLLALYLLQRSFPWHADRDFDNRMPSALKAMGQRIELLWQDEGSKTKGKLRMMWDRFYLASFWSDRFAIARSLLLLPTDDVREMLNRRSGMKAGLARMLVPLLTVRGYWRR